MKALGYRKRLQQAYIDLFGGSNEQGEMILEDLANLSGFFQALDPGHSSEVLQHYEGRRALFCHVLRMGRSNRAQLGLPEAERTIDWNPGEERKSA